MVPSTSPCSSLIHSEGHRFPPMGSYLLLGTQGGQEGVEQVRECHCFPPTLLALVLECPWARQHLTPSTAVENCCWLVWPTMSLLHQWVSICMNVTMNRSIVGFVYVWNCVFNLVGLCLWKAECLFKCLFKWGNCLSMGQGVYEWMNLCLNGRMCVETGDCVYTESWERWVVRDFSDHRGGNMYECRPFTYWL